MGLGTGLVIAGTIGAQLFGARKQAKAAEKASEQQQQAANRALDIQQQQYQQTRQDLTPYMQSGGQGLSALTSLLGVAPPPGATPAPGPPSPVPGVTPVSHAVARAPSQVSAPGMVLLRAPTGQTQAVPADQASFFLARGAQRV